MRSEVSVWMVLKYLMLFRTTFEVRGATCVFGYDGGV